MADGASIQNQAETFAGVERSATGRRWALRAWPEREALAIAQGCGVDSALAQALAARGLTLATASDYLDPSLRTAMPDPSVLRDMDAAAARLARAVIDGEGVGVFGDYDVDGTTAAALLKRYFNALGAPLDVHLPDRMTEGYGPNIAAFLALKERGAKVIVTVDCGASAFEVLEAAKAEGIDVVVLDHHQMDDLPPPAAAVVNPNRPDDISGLTNLSAAGVVFMLLAALARTLRAEGYFKERTEPNLLSFLDLVALGLVCDVMPMTGLARVLTAQGLKVLGANGNTGLAALSRAAGVKSAPTGYTLGFLLGPRINASGRIGHARLAFELLTTSDAARAEVLAARLEAMNAERRRIEDEVLADAEVQALNAGDAPVLTVAGDGWHAGVIGIVAGRLRERFGRPAFVIGLDGDTGKGSGRSMPGVDIGAAVRAAHEAGLLIAGGGHAAAAGLTIARDQVAEFSAFLSQRLSADIARARAEATLTVDGAVGLRAVTSSLARSVARAGPFGPGNPEPRFVLQDVRLDHVETRGEKHVSCRLVGRLGESVRAIAFRAAGQPLGDALYALQGTRAHVAVKIRADDWRGGEAGEAHIEDVAAVS